MQKLIITFLILTSFVVSADDKLKFSGFGTLGLVLSDSSQFGYRSDLAKGSGAFEGDTDFATSSVLGLQMDFSPTENLGFVAQLVHRNQDEISVREYLNLAFLQYSPTPAWDLRLGRTALELFTLTEFRDVGFAYPWAAVPTEIYGIIPNRNIDGVDLSYVHQFKTFSLRSKVFRGASESLIQTQNALPSETVELDRVRGLTLELEAFDWNLGAKVTEVSIDKELPSTQSLFDILNQLPEELWPGARELAGDMSLKNSRAIYSSLSGSYDYGQWSLMSELARVRSTSDTVATLKNGYISLIKHQAQHSFYTIYSYTSSRAKDFSAPPAAQYFLPELVAGVQQAFDSFASSQRTLSLGWRWDLSEALAFKMQANRTIVDENGSTLWLNRDPAGSRPKERINTLFASLNFTF